ncbi:hypothetical protein ACTXJT_08655 [Corynebacterium casei]|uniref:hypothetical protein n=1 Tax=Corynebacterium casei TaxID=160386 RepID=UPI003FD169B7
MTNASFPVIPALSVLIVDFWRLYFGCAESYDDQSQQKQGIIGTHCHDLLDSGKLPAGRVAEIA